jgi:hypothetical protein
VASVVCTICGLLTRFNLRWRRDQEGLVKDKPLEGRS